ERRTEAIIERVEGAWPVGNGVWIIRVVRRIRLAGRRGRRTLGRRARRVRAFVAIYVAEFFALFITGKKEKEEEKEMAYGPTFDDRRRPTESLDVSRSFDAGDAGKNKNEIDLSQEHLPPAPNDVGKPGGGDLSDASFNSNARQEFLQEQNQTKSQQMAEIDRARASQETELAQRQEPTPGA
ncbi:MAG: hypothetical protein IKY61_02620, partial [Thermoguttaceae bacterium]|nr:hypothetical protein [Thermoguttaceae bacterium]